MSQRRARGTVGPRKPVTESQSPMPAEGPISDVSIVDGARVISDVAPMRHPALHGATTGPPPLLTTGHAELLRVAGALPIEAGTGAVARVICEAVRDAVLCAAAGVSLREADGTTTVITAVSPEASDVEASASTSVPPQRMFAQLEDEWIVPLPPPLEGSSFHLADATPRRVSREPGRSVILAELAERAALLLTSGLCAARSVRTTRSDSSELRALQARIIQSEKLASVGHIAAKVVHELNNPLTAIVTYSAFLTKKLERAGHDEADVERLRRIGESADRILRFSRDLTTYARPRDETTGPVPLSEVLERAVLFCEHIVVEQGIKVSLRVDPATPSILGMRGQLTQVFVNLITNACHAIQDAGRIDDGLIDIVAEPTANGAAAAVSVGDNGNGISPENVIRVFDPFYTTKAEGRGTGLGLSIVRSIVEGHGGRVWVRSVLGGGTQFIVELASRPRP